KAIQINTSQDQPTQSIHIPSSKEAQTKQTKANQLNAIQAKPRQDQPTQLNTKQEVKQNGT
ncbi:unnamed protein product, partial [marine sediment metagenome]